ncbi:MAG: zinc carboxypeptidase [Candidatus Brocadiae bacterium]|nr:zinc carboxypeptidase [Candidatus Brocadiia bacterium]
MPQRLITLFFFVFCFGLLFVVQAEEKYSMVDIKVPYQDLEAFHQLCLPIDECEREFFADYCRFSVALNQHDIDLLKNSRFPFIISIDNLQEHYVSRFNEEELKKAKDQLSLLQTEMQLGSMKGYYTLDETAKIMDSLYQKYGSKKLITAKKSIGKSFQGRDIYMFKISDNADLEESDKEPQVLYTSLTHAREPAGMMAIFYFVYHLLENYEKDSRVRSIVDNREIYFIPVVNPDGYLYNHNNGSGGGMWRKNRNGSGVDLNRNFGPHELWNYPNSGSSTSPSSDTYRGSAAFSEKETQVVRDFVLSKNIKTALNYHTYSNLLIYPWGYKNEIAHPMFVTMAKEMTKINGYRYGTAQGLLYAVRGDSDSWFYKEAKTFAMTPEVGKSSDGFWPSSSRIFPLAQENLESNLLLAEYAGQVPTK